jgi:hypothetical protein
MELIELTSALKGIEFYLSLMTPGIFMMGILAIVNLFEKINK